MNKTELVEAMADAADISKASAARALEGMVEAITNTIKKEDTVSIVGFGTFSLRARSARAGRNPKTGETIQIAASKSPAFKAGKAFKESVN